MIERVNSEHRDHTALAASGNRVDQNLRLIDSEIVFKGTNNHVVADGTVELLHSTIEFESDNALVFLAKPADSYQVDIHLGFGCTVYFGPDSTFTGPTGIYGAEEANIIVGPDCMFDTGAGIWNTDFCPMWDATTGLRLNPSASIYLGQHVRLGKNAHVLKGVTIGSGVMVGAYAVVSKKTGPNLALAGNPARIVQRHIRWTRHALGCDALFNRPETERPCRMPLPGTADNTLDAPYRFEAPLGQDENRESRCEAALQDLYGLCENVLHAGFDPAPKAAFLRNAVLPFVAR